MHGHFGQNGTRRHSTPSAPSARPTRWVFIPAFLGLALGDLGCSSPPDAVSPGQSPALWGTSLPDQAAPALASGIVTQGPGVRRTVAGPPAVVPAEETGLPVMHLQVAPELLSAERGTPAEVTYRGRPWTAEVKLHGRSSLAYPKKSFGLKFSRTDLFSDDARGFVARRRLVLISTFDDASHLRQRLAFELWNRLGAGVPVWVSSVVVYVNGEYQGLYTLADHLDEDLLTQHGLAPGSTLYKAVLHDATFDSTDYLGEAFEQKEGPPDPTFPDLAELIGVVAGGEDLGARTQDMQERLDLRSYRGWLILATALLATDTLAKNALHHHDASDGKWRYLPWDWNASFGQDWQTYRLDPDMEPLALARASNRIFARLLDDAALGADTRAQYREALAGAISRTAVLDLVDRLVSEVAAAARRDDERWSAEQRAFAGWCERGSFEAFDGEVAYLRRWIGERWERLGAALAP